MSHRHDLRERHLIAVIGDQDTITGMLLAGVGNVDTRNQKNYFLVDQKTQLSAVEEAFDDLTTRKDIAILLINQHVADMIREKVNSYQEIMPALLEIPSKDHPYDPDKDTILQRVNRMYASD